MEKLIYPDSFINKILNMDCLEAMRDIPDKSVDLVLTDPPYGVAKATWDIIDYKLLFPELYRVMKVGACIYVFGAIWTFEKLLVSSKKFFEHLNTCIWLYPNGMNRLENNWQICYDPVFFGKKQGEHYFDTDGIRVPYTEGAIERMKNPNIKGGKEWKAHPNGRKLENVLVVPCLNHGAGIGERTEHPTQKPVDLIKLYIKASSKQGDLILDPYLGSGTVAVAAKNLGRNFIGIEISEEYCKIARERLKQEILL